MPVLQPMIRAAVFRFQAIKKIYSLPQIFVGFVLFMMVPLRAHSQIRADWSRLETDYSSYSTPYECNSAVTRIRAAFPDRTMRDTLPSRIAASTQRVSTEAKDVAQRCVEQIDVGELPRTQLLPMMWLYLSADRDKDAEKMVVRLLDNAQQSAGSDTLETAGIEGNSSMGRKAQIHEVAATNYLNATPARISAALTHVKALESLDGVKPATRIRLYYIVFNRALAIGDSTQAIESARRALDIAQTQMSPDQRQQSASTLFNLRQFVNKKASLDSLRKNTEAYIALQRSLMREFNVNDPFLGEQMDTLEGVFRFPASSALPGRGKVSLVVVPGGPPMALSTVFPMLRRLKEKFPEIDVVYSSTTRGHIDNQLVEPEREAAIQREWVQDALKMPFVVIVEQSPSWHLPEPDQRRMIGLTPNVEKYGGRLWLVDQTGAIVFYGKISKDQEDELGNLIAILTRRDKR